LTWRSFVPNGRDPEDFYLVVSRLVPYKRVDLAIEACNRLGRRLVIVGDGPERRRLEAIAGDTVEFVGRSRTRRSRICTHAAAAFSSRVIEDFGITPVEAQAAGGRWSHTGGAERGDGGQRRHGRAVR
jgi:glycosyltransferase involved in cell wall biosynthesis